MTTAANLATLCGDAFPNNQAAAITLANSILGTTDGDGDGEDAATAILAYNILVSQRKAGKGYSDNTIATLDLSTLITPEIERLLNKSKASTISSIFNYKQPPTSSHWSRG